MLLSIAHLSRFQARGKGVVTWVRLQGQNSFSRPGFRQLIPGRLTVLRSLYRITKNHRISVKKFSAVPTRPPPHQLEFRNYFDQIYIDGWCFFVPGSTEGVTWVQLECRDNSRDPRSHGDGWLTSRINPGEDSIFRMGITCIG